MPSEGTSFSIIAVFLLKICQPTRISNAPTIRESAERYIQSFLEVGTTSGSIVIWVVSTGGNGISFTVSIVRDYGASGKGDGGIGPTTLPFLSRQAPQGY